MILVYKLCYWILVNSLEMEKLKQKVALLQENIETTRFKVDKTQAEVEHKKMKIEDLTDKIENLNTSIGTVDNDLDLAEGELVELKGERKRLTDDEEEKDRGLRKITRFVDQSKAGASGLQAKIQSNESKLEQLKAEIEDKENNINIYEQDLEMAEEANNAHKDELAALNLELAEATAVHQSITSSRASITGAGGNLRNQVTKKTIALKEKKDQLDELEQLTEQLEIEREKWEDLAEEANTKLLELKAENEKLIQEFDEI